MHEVISMENQEKNELNTDEKNSSKGMDANLVKSRLVNQNQGHNVKKEALGPNTKR